MVGFEVIAASAAAVADAAVGRTHSPARLRRLTTGRLFFRAKRTSTYPIVPALSLTKPATPSFCSCGTTPFGHFGLVLAPTSFRNDSLDLLRYSVKMLVVPLDSARATTTMSRAGRVTPGFRVAMRSSF